LTAVVDVDLLRMDGKRYYFVDPLLRTWLLLYGGGGVPAAADRAAQAARLLEPPAPAEAVSPRSKRPRAAHPALAPAPAEVPAANEEPKRIRPRDTLMEID